VVVVAPSLVRARALEGYASGVHLWETLPLDPAVLAARMRALSLRIVGDDASLEVSVALDRASRSVWVEGKVVKLGPRGFALFEYLLERRGRWVGQQEIVERLFRAKHAVGSPVVRVHVLRVREALGEEHAWILQGKEGHGYRIILRRDSTAGRLHLPHARFRARRR
jgi:two-component system, OmpR family, phosphate regulon response regulator PhoB